MSTTHQTAPAEAPADPLGPAAERRLPAAVGHPIGLGLASALLHWMSFPPVEWHAAAWFSMVPLFLLLVDRRSPVKVYLGAWLGGLAFWLLAIQWILATDSSAWLGWLAMALALSAWWPAFVFVTRDAHRRLGLPITVVAPVAWVGLEYLRAHVLTGFPWYYLAHSQFRQVAWLQVADIAGSLGLSFLIALVNATIVEFAAPFLFPGVGYLATRPRWARLAIASASFLGVLGYGIFRTSTGRFEPGPRVALLQSDEVQEFESDHRKSSLELLGLYESMVVKAAQANPRPDLIVWPETSFPYGFVTIEPELSPKSIDELVKSFDPEGIAADWILKRDRVTEWIDRMVNTVRIPMILGTTTHDFRSTGYTRYNSALLFQPGQTFRPYHKLHLVPFGEYIPLVEALPWLTNLTPYRGTRIPLLTFGEGPTWFNLGPFRLAPAICFEDTVPHVVRRFFSEFPDDGQPDVIVNLSNDGWFHETSEHEMHLAVSVFRCVENRSPMVRAVNTGVSAIIDGNGRILASMSKDRSGVLEGVVPLDPRSSLYIRWGDWLGQVGLATLVGLVVLCRFLSVQPAFRPDRDAIVPKDLG